jgi:hypothetical protein
MNPDAIDIIGDPAVIKKIIELAKSEKLTVSEPMAAGSISDALDAPFGVDEIRAVADIVTIVMSAGVSVVGFLAAVKALLAKSETATGAEPVVAVRHTKTQKKDWSSWCKYQYF